MFAPGIHETASNISNTESIALTAGTARAVSRVGTVFVVGDRVDYTLRHKTADEMESGRGIYSATNTLKRVLPLQDDSGVVTARRTFSAGDVDVLISPARGGIVPMLAGVVDNTPRALLSEHQTNHVGTTAATADRVYCFPFRRQVRGKVTHIRDHVTSAVGTKYRWSIRRANLITLLPDEEIWQSGDITPGAGALNTAVTNFEYYGEPLWLIALCDDALVQKSLIGNYSGPNHGGVLGANSRNITYLFGTEASWSSIPATLPALTASTGDAWKPMLVIA